MRRRRLRCVWRRRLTTAVSLWLKFGPLMATPKNGLAVFRVGGRDRLGRGRRRDGQGDRRRVDRARDGRRLPGGVGDRRRHGGGDGLCCMDRRRSGWGRMMPGVLPSVSWGASVPFKANADRRHHIPKQRHRVTNSAVYDAALRQRGSLTVLVHSTQPSRRGRRSPAPREAASRDIRPWPLLWR